MEGMIYEERAFVAENRVEKLEKLLTSCRAAMIVNMSDPRIMVGCDWSHMIKAIEDAVSN